jgi:hypothetical protein
MDGQGLYEIYDFWHIPFWQTSWFKLFVGSSVAAILFVALAFMWRFLHARRKRRPLWEEAFFELNAIRGRDLGNSEERRVVYDEITRLLKNYCVRRYGWDVGGLTDKEVIVFLANNKVDSRLQQAFSHVACGCELIKFAQESVNRDRVLADCALCEEFIRATIPLEQRR